MASQSLFRPSPSSLCQRCRRLIARQQQSHQFSSSTLNTADKHNAFADSLRSGGVLGQALSTPKSQEQSLREIQQQKQREENQAKRTRFLLPAKQMSKALTEATSSAEAGMANRPSTEEAFGELHHLHLYATKHNTHITLTRPNREPMLSLSAGNINFKKAHRGTFDAAYQLVTYSITQMIEKGFMQNIKRLEVILRGSGPGREAFQKVLLGTEGKLIKPKVARVTDSTRLKFGGTRSPGVRRL
jgi:small subunit ribosomal protein S11